MKMFGCLLVGAALCAVAVSPATAGPLAILHAGSAGLEWRPLVADAGLTLTISGPGGSYLRQELAPGQSPSFSLFDAAGSLRPDGTYVWELRAVFQLDAATRGELEALRQSGDESALQKSGKLPGGRIYESGSFSIQGGRIVALDLVEPQSPRTETGLAPKGATLAPRATFTEGVCAGFDCPASPAFGDSTILMMENNTRIKFGDTSNSPFPNNDWEIEANSAVSGGLSYLGFNDCGTADNDGGCATDLVFAVEAGARQNSLYVEGDGDVGLGTANPVLDFHIVTGNTPALRLEQDSSSGFTAQTWDIAGNEANFFVRDVTSGSALPFKIQPGADTNSLVIESTNDVGIGTLSPTASLHVRRTDGTAKALVTEASGTTTARELLELNNNGAPIMVFANSADASVRWTIGMSGTTFIWDDQADAPVEMSLDQAGNVTITGQLVTGGPQCGPATPCDLVFAPDFQVESIEEHAALMWANSYLPAVGPTLRGAPMNVSEKTGGILNELEKAHIYIEQLHGTIEELRADNLEQGRALRGLEERLARVEDSVSTKLE